MTTPHTVFDAMVERVLEAWLGHGARRTDRACSVDADAIAGEERRGGMQPTVALLHPGGSGVIVVHNCSYVADGREVPNRPDFSPRHARTDASVAAESERYNRR